MKWSHAHTTHAADQPCVIQVNHDLPAVCSAGDMQRLLLRSQSSDVIIHCQLFLVHINHFLYMPQQDDIDARRPMLAGRQSHMFMYMGNYVYSTVMLSDDQHEGLAISSP